MHKFFYNRLAVVLSTTFRKFNSTPFSRHSPSRNPAFPRNVHGPHVMLTEVLLYPVSLYVETRLYILPNSSAGSYHGGGGGGVATLVSGCNCARYCRPFRCVRLFIFFFLSRGWHAGREDGAVGCSVAAGDES